MSDVLGEGTHVDESMVCVRGGAAGEESQPTMCSGDSVCFLGRDISEFVDVFDCKL